MSRRPNNSTNRQGSTSIEGSLVVRNANNAGDGEVETEAIAVLQVPGPSGVEAK